MKSRPTDPNGEHGRKPGAPAGDAALGPHMKRRWAALAPEQQGLVSQYIGLVGMHLRKRVPTPDEPMRHREYDDLFQEGCVALVRAAARYDPQHDGPFAPYALLRIRGAIHNALRDRFSAVHVPARALTRAQALPLRSSPLGPEPSLELTNELLIDAADGADSGGDGETIGHVVRRRFERAVGQALADLRGRRWRRRNPCPIMARIAADRLLVPSERERTPLRRIAREAGVSSGRVWAYQRQLMDAVRQHFEQDPLLPLLLCFAREDPAGFAGIVDSQRGQILLQTDLNAFEARFAQLDRAARAQLVYEMIERSTAAVAEVARNLYGLTASDESRSTGVVTPGHLTEAVP